MAEQRTTSAANELGPDHQAESLSRQEPVAENFNDKADPTRAAQIEAMKQNDLERAESTDSGSQMVSEEGSRLNMNPPEAMREGVDRQAFNERIAQEKSMEDKLKEIDNDLKVDSNIENTSDYENDMR